MKLLVINGPNLNMLGIREPAIYGKQDFKALEKFIRESARELGHEVTLFQSNHEGEIVDIIQAAYGVYECPQALGSSSRLLLRHHSLALLAPESGSKIT